eukprot:GILK01001988.1.p1 GENE.GILK01001988.1~~GILK01001988.1.p1  ORF type:complete len:318 (-),score=43.73 GILK01001988.1:94-1002(-)
MADYEELSDAEKMKIVRHFLISSPPGEIHEVLADCQKLVPRRLLEEDKLQDIFATYNEEHLTPVPLPQQEHKGLISADGKIDSKHYLDPKSRLVFEVNHVRGTSAGTRAASSAQLPDEAEPYRDAIQQAVTAYVNQYYPENMCHFAVYSKMENGNVTITVCLSSKSVNLRNFWSGGWRSRWQLSFIPHQKGPIELKGSVKIDVHYYEDGNVQMKEQKPVSVSIPEHQDAAALGAAVAAAIQNAETELQSALEDMYVSLSDETFRAMRRVLPITGERMDWNIARLRMVRNLGGGGGAGAAGHH